MKTQLPIILLTPPKTPRSTMRAENYPIIRITQVYCLFCRLMLAASAQSP